MLNINIHSELNSPVLKAAQVNNLLREFPLIADADETVALWLNKEIYPVWTMLHSALPVDCRCLVYGRAALVAPKSGEILAMVLGTFYILRVPPGMVEVALENETTGRITELMKKRIGLDPGRDFGIGWIYGTTIDQECGWCRALYDAVEGLCDT